MISFSGVRIDSTVNYVSIVLSVSTVSIVNNDSTVGSVSTVGIEGIDGAAVMPASFAALNPSR